MGLAGSCRCLGRAGPRCKLSGAPGPVSDSKPEIPIPEGSRGENPRIILPLFFREIPGLRPCVGLYVEWCWTSQQQLWHIPPQPLTLARWMKQRLLCHPIPKPSYPTLSPLCLYIPLSHLCFSREGPATHQHVMSVWNRRGGRSPPPIAVHTHRTEILSKNKALRHRVGTKGNTPVHTLHLCFSRQVPATHQHVMSVWNRLSGQGYLGGGGRKGSEFLKYTLQAVT